MERCIPAANLTIPVLSTPYTYASMRKYKKQKPP